MSIAGASQVVAIDPSPYKRAQALELGATEAIHPAQGDVVQQVKHATAGRGVDFAFEALGHAATIIEARQMTRLGGTTVIIGATGLDEQVTFNAFDLHREGRILGCGYGSSQVRRDFPRLIRLAESGQLDLKSMASREVGLYEVNDGLRMLSGGDVVRCVIVPSSDHKQIRAGTSNSLSPDPR